MNELIKIENKNGIETVNARDLHAKLEVGKIFAGWIQERIIKYGFIENHDYIVWFPNLESEVRGGQNRKEYYVSTDMAKQLAMVENNEPGRIVRKYFIDVENRAKQIQFYIPKTLSEALRLAADQSELIEQQQLQLQLAQPKLEHYNAIAKTESHMSITEACKHFNIAPKLLVFPWLREHRLLTSKDLPTQLAINMGLMSTKQSRPDQNGNTHTQAVIQTNQLEAFKLKVIDKIYADLALDK